MIDIFFANSDSMNFYLIVIVVKVGAWEFQVGWVENSIYSTFSQNHFAMNLQELVWTSL